MQQMQGFGMISVHPDSDMNVGQTTWVVSYSHSNMESLVDLIYPETRNDIKARLLNRYPDSEPLEKMEGLDAVRFQTPEIPEATARLMKSLVTDVIGIPDDQALSIVVNNVPRM